MKVKLFFEKNELNLYLSVTIYIFVTQVAQESQSHTSNEAGVATCRKLCLRDGYHTSQTHDLSSTVLASASMQLLVYRYYKTNIQRLKANCILSKYFRKLRLLYTKPCYKESLTQKCGTIFFLVKTKGEQRAVISHFEVVPHFGIQDSLSHSIMKRITNI